MKGKKNKTLNIFISFRLIRYILRLLCRYYIAGKTLGDRSVYLTVNMQKYFGYCELFRCAFIYANEALSNVQICITYKNQKSSIRMMTGIKIFVSLSESSPGKELFICLLINRENNERRMSCT